MSYIVILLVISIVISLLFGYRVAFTLGGISIIFGYFFLGVETFYLLPLRIFGIMKNFVLIAVPLFIFMGLVFKNSGTAEELLEGLEAALGSRKSSIPISIVIVGTLLAASTGIVGATVVTMGVISLPTMMKNGFNQKFSTGVIISSGTLGQIIPPSIVLVLLGSVLNVPVGKLFFSALIPGILLVTLYILYILMYCHVVFNGNNTTVIKQKNSVSLVKIVSNISMPFSLIFLVLGSIYFGVASPTEAACVGSIGALIISIIKNKFTFKMVKDSLNETVLITGMVFTILIGATVFGLVFRELNGEEILINYINNLNLNKHEFILILMLVIFVAGFFIDFIEIIFILIPIVIPILEIYNIDLTWIGILIALNLQTSFLHHPLDFHYFI